MPMSPSKSPRISSKSTSCNSSFRPRSHVWNPPSKSPMSARGWPIRSGLGRYIFMHNNVDRVVVHLFPLVLFLPLVLVVLLGVFAVQKGSRPSSSLWGEHRSVPPLRQFRAPPPARKELLHAQELQRRRPLTIQHIGKLQPRAGLADQGLGLFHFHPVLA